MARVLMVVDAAPPQYGGAGQQAMLLSDKLSEFGHIVNIVARKKEKVSSERRNVKFIGPYLKSSFMSNLIFAFLVFLRVLISRADIVHCHGAFYYGFGAGLAAKLRGKPYILKVTLLGVDDPQSVREQRKLRIDVGRIMVRQFYWASFVIALNEEIYERVLDYDKEIRTKLIPNGISIEYHLRQHRQISVTEFESKAPVVIFTGDICARKGADNLVRAWPQFADQNPGALLHLVGPMRDEVADLIKDIPVRYRDDIVLHGLVSQSRTVELLVSATIFILPSHREGLPNSLIEALGLGLSCVASEITVNRNVCKEAAIYCDPSSPSGIANALQTAYARYREMSFLALERSLTFDIAPISIEYSELYDRLTALTFSDGPQSDEEA